MNIILDPIFIFGLGMGVRGAALATIISQGVSAIWVLKFLFGKKSTIKIRKIYFKPDIKIVGSICALGVSPFIMYATESFLQITFNNQLSRYGGTMAVGTMAILLSLFQMVSMPLQGLCQGSQPIMSYNYGAGNMERVRKTFRLLYVSCLTFSLVAIGLILTFSQTFANIFTNDPEALRMAEWAIRVYLVGCLVFGAQIACQQSFVALGQAKRSLVMALFRKIILLIPLIFILPEIIGGTNFAINLAAPVADLCKDGGKVFAVLFAESVSDIIAAVVTTGFFYSFYKKCLKNGPEKVDNG